MKTREIESLANFIKEIDSLESGLIIFRGQPVKRKLIPAIARSNPKKDVSSIEAKMLKQIELMGASLLNGSISSKLDVLVNAQHHGLKTRLLDWTSNPLIAMWFACAEVSETKNDAYVYALSAQDFLVENVYNEDPYKKSKTRVFQPRLNNSRIIAQHGWFTLHKYSDDGFFVALENNREIKGHLTEFVIKGENKKKIIKSLDRHGISERTVFPDLKGLCGYLNWKYID